MPSSQNRIASRFDLISYAIRLQYETERNVDYFDKREGAETPMVKGFGLLFVRQVSSGVAQLSVLELLLKQAIDRVSENLHDGASQNSWLV